MLPTAIFKKNNQSFVCEHCGKKVSPHPSSSRDHCVYCLYGKHVDIFPGDRQNTCQGLLIPIGIELKGDRKRIVYTCQKCNTQIKNIIAPDDNEEEILQLVSKVW